MSSAGGARSRSSRRAARAVLAAGAAPAAAAVVAFALARSTLLPGLGFWDTGEFQVVPPLLGTAHPTGYPTYVLLGWLASGVLAPAGEPALRMNLLSAILLATAAALVVVLVRALTGRVSIAAAAGLALALAPSPWTMGTLADPHTLHLALLALLLVALVEWERRARGRDAHADRWLVGAAVVYGLMLGNHSLTVLLAPGVALFVLAVEPRILRRRRQVAACAAAVVGTTALLYLELPIRAAMGAPLVYGHPDTWGGFWYVVLGAQFLGGVATPLASLGDSLVGLARFAGQQLGILAAFVPAAFLATVVRRPRYALLTGTSLVITCWFAASYPNAAIDRYYLGPVLIAVTWLAVGASLVADAVAEAVLPGWEPVAAGAAPGGDLGRPSRVAGAVGLAAAVALVLPGALAAPSTAAGLDLSHETQAADWGRWALANMDEGAVVVSWWSFSTPLWYRTLVLGERPDVRVVDDRTLLDDGLGSVDDVVRANLDARPVYLVRLPDDLAALAAAWRLEEIPDPLGIQPLYRVVGPAASPGAEAPTVASPIRQAGVARMRA